MNTEKLDKLLDNLTSGLDGDLEVKLDVRNELQAHLEDKITAAEESGLSEAESIEQAIKSFGDTIAISDGLIEANFARMKFKARLYKIAMIILIPAVIFCAILSSLSFFGKLRPSFFFSPDKIIYAGASGNAIGRLTKNLTTDEKLIMYGDRTRKTRPEQQKAIWERFPDNKVFLANYILSILNNKTVTADTVLVELKKAKTIDPDNSLYNYLTADILLKKGCKMESKRVPVEKNKAGRSKYKYEYFIKVTDPKFMALAIKEYLAGTKKKYFHSYAWEMMNKRLDILGSPESVTDNLLQISISASTLLPYLTILRSNARAIWQYAVILQKEGKQADALKIANSWEKYVRQITDDSHCLIEMLVDTALVAAAQKNIPEIYRKAGLEQTAQQADTKMARVINKIQAWRTGVKKQNINRTQMAKVGILGSIALPALGGMEKYSDDDIAVSRKIEYAAIDNKAVLVLNIVLFLTMTGAFAGSYYWRHRAGRKALLLAPEIKFAGKLFLLGIILPLLGYFVISTTEIIGGHDYNFMHSFINFASQWFLLFTVIPMIILSLIKRKVGKRCLDLELAVPEMSPGKIALSIKILFLSVFIFFALFPVKTLLRSWESTIVYNITVGAILVGSLIIFWVHAVYGLIKSLKERRYALYYGALSRMLALLLGLAIIFITVAIKPCLDWREASLIKQDKIIYGSPKLFTPIEYRVSMMLKKIILDNLDDHAK